VSETLTAASLRGLPPERQLQAVESLLRVKAGSLLGIAPDKIPGERGLLEMGLDSLMAVELRNWIEGQLEINMPISSLMRSNSLQQLMADICSRIADAALVALPKPVPPAGPAVSDAQAAELLARLPELGEQEVQQLLSQMLREG
jgi:acyl carrier protein